MAAKIFRINYKSDFILTLNSDAGWMTPFCIKFWTGAPSQAFFVGWDGETYTHCAPVAGEPTKLLVQFDDHHLPIGDLKFQIAYHFTVADFPNDTEDEVINPANITTEIDGETYQVMLDFTGETAPEIEFSLPAYANEAQRIANEEQRIAHEAIRIVNEESRIAAETIRQQNEAQRIAHETARVNEFATLKSQSQAATRDANDAATLANQKAQLAQDKADLAQAAATLANQKAQLAADKAALANDAAQLAADKAALAKQKAEYAQQQGSYAKDQGDYAKNQGDYAKEQGDTALADHVRANADHSTAAADHTTAGNDHTRAESDHSTAAADHTTAGNDHTRAESDHGIAVDDHMQAGNDHTRAESDHTTAAADHTTAGNDHTRAESDHTRAESDHAAVEVYVDSLGAFDISAYHATGGVLAEYADLTAALGTNGANIPDALRKGGMSVKFVSSSDHKYVQYRLMHSLDNPSTAAADFANTANWQGVDSEPTAGSKNLVESGGVKAAIDANNIIEGKTFYVTDGDGNIIAKIDKDGVHSVDFKIGNNGDSVAEAINGISGQISSAVNAEKLLREQGDTAVTLLVEAEKTRAKAVEDTKLNYTIIDDKFCITDANGYIICQIDASGVHSVNIDENPNTIDDNQLIITDSQGYIIAKVDSEGVHAPNIFEGSFNDNKLIITDNNGYIICKIDANGVHSAKDKHAVACMVLSEAYYPTSAPTRDSDGNVTYAEVMFETGVAGSISITYVNGNSSSVAVVYGNYNYTLTINRDVDGNVETVSVN